MCGIAGYFGKFDLNLLKEMNQSIAHRGPDDEGTWHSTENGIGLAQRRLSIIDLSPQGHQPMWDTSKSVVITYNGEIYNFPELRSQLEKDGFQFNSRSDTEVLLNLYLRDGHEMLSQLNGIFAFAIWDTRSKELFLARDGFGVKPLYYSNTKKGLLFASELKALLRSPEIERELSPKAIHSYLTYCWCPAPQTMLKGVSKLEPGTAFLVKDAQIQKKWKFYSLPYHQDIQDLSVSEATEQLRHYLSQAVKRQMIADVPVGAFLSGGLDSSAIVHFTKTHLASSEQLSCFTIGFKDNRAKWQKVEGVVDDLPYAKRVAKHLGVDLHTIYVGAEMTDYLAQMVYQLDEPQADLAPINALFISQLAREHNIKVLLSGSGGDDIFGGYRRHYALQQERYWSWLPKFARKGLREITTRIPTNTPSGRRLAKAFAYADWDQTDRIASYFFWLRPQILQQLFVPELQQGLNRDTSLQALKNTLGEFPADIPPLNKMLAVEAKHFLCDHNLNYTDKMAMAVGVEVRVPFLDPNLVAFAARLPIHYKQHGSTGKWIFKKAMEDILPHNVIYRPKSGFGAPLRKWLQQDLKNLLEETLSIESLSARGIFDPTQVHKLLQLHQNGHIDAAYPIFGLICIELWCRSFLDGAIPTQLSCSKSLQRQIAS